MGKEEKQTAKSNPLVKHIGKPEELENLSNEQLGGMLGSLVASDDNEITSEYLKIEVGEGVRAFFLEMVEINKLDGAPGEKTQAARLLLDSGKFAINADVVVVSTCSNLKRNTPIEIICTGKTGPKNREYKTFKIIKLTA